MAQGGEITGFVESLNPTGIRVNGSWYNFPPNPDESVPRPERGTRIAMRVGGRYIRWLKLLDPPQHRIEPDVLIARESILKAAVGFFAARPDVKSPAVTVWAERWEQWVLRPVRVESFEGPRDAPPDRDRRIARQSVLRSAAVFLASRPEAQPEHVLPLAERWEQWTLRAPAKAEPLVCADGGEPLEDVTFGDGTRWSAADLARYGRQRFGRVLCHAHFLAAGGDAETAPVEAAG